MIQKVLVIGVHGITSYNDLLHLFIVILKIFARDNLKSLITGVDHLSKG